MSDRECVMEQIQGRHEALARPLVVAWPDEGDALGAQAWLGAPDVVYAEGYKRAGDLLVESLERGRGHTDFLVYPAIYLYRHAVELMLKLNAKAAFGYRYWSPSRRQQDILHSHNLEDLFGVLEAALGAYGYGASRGSQLEDLRDRISELHDLDAGSYESRYSKARDGVTLSFPDLLGINLIRLRDGVQAVWDTLDGYWTDIVERWHHREEEYYENQP